MKLNNLITLFTLTTIFQNSYQRLPSDRNLTYQKYPGRPYDPHPYPGPRRPFPDNPPFPGRPGYPGPKPLRPQPLPRPIPYQSKIRRLPQIPLPILEVKQIKKEADKTPMQLAKIINKYLATSSNLLSDDLVNFTLDSRYKKIQKKNTKQIIPLKISLKYPEINVEEIRTALDLIIVIDVSGSMSGQKIKLVKETLTFIIDQLSSVDRLGLVTFNNNAKVLSGIKYMNDFNKKILKGLVNSISANGSTDIVDGLNKGLDMLSQKDKDFERKRTNAVFFLSDGRDTDGNSLSGLQQALLNQNQILKRKNIEYVIHSFGYGSGHDENWLTAISDFKNGNFYYIKDLNLVADSIIDPLSALLTVIGREAKIKVFLQDDFFFSQKFGNNWQHKYKKKEGEINVGNITPEMDRDFLAEIYIENLNDHKVGDIINVATAVLTYKTDNGEVLKVIQLKLEVIGEKDNLGIINKDVEEAYYKQLAALELKSFQKLRSQGKYNEANRKIKSFRGNFGSNANISRGFKQKLERATNINRISDKKVSKQLYNVLSMDQYAPGYVNFKSQANSAAKRTEEFYAK